MLTVKSLSPHIMSCLFSTVNSSCWIPLLFRLYTFYIFKKIHVLVFFQMLIFTYHDTFILPQQFHFRNWGTLTFLSISKIFGCLFGILSASCQLFSFESEHDNSHWILQSIWLCVIEDFFQCYVFVFIFSSVFHCVGKACYQCSYESPLFSWVSLLNLKIQKL